MKTAVIGAGTMGMTLGYRLAKAGHEVTVLESSPQIGGLATWHDYGTFVWDKYYHVILKQDANLLALARDLGIADAIEWRETKTGFLWNGRLVSMSNNWEFLQFPVLSLWSKLRLGLGILYVQRVTDPAPLERITARAWLTRVFGRRVYDRIWGPLLASKYGTLAARVPATIMWATIRRYYATRNKGDGKETLGYLRGGLRTLFAALHDAIESAGGTVETGAQVSRIDTGESGVAVTVNGAERVFDRVVSTVPSHTLQRLTRAPEFAAKAGESQPSFLGVICMALVLRKPLTPYYVTNLVQPGLPFTGIIEVSALTGPDEMGGRHLVMLPRYDVPDSVWFSRPSAEIAEEFLGALRRIWPDIDSNVDAYHVHRATHVQALWLSPPPEAAGPATDEGGRLWSVNAELAGRDTLNNNAIIGVAEQAARDIAAAGKPVQAGSGLADRVPNGRTAVAR